MHTHDARDKRHQKSSHKYGALVRQRRVRHPFSREPGDRRRQQQQVIIENESRRERRRGHQRGVLHIWIARWPPPNPGNDSGSG